MRKQNGIPADSGLASFDETVEVEARTVVLISLAQGIDLLQTIFGRKEMKGRKAHVEALIKGEKTGAATREVIEACQAAVMAAAVAGMAATTAVST